MWEDEANKRGGRWLINIDRKQRSSDLDRFWLDVVRWYCEIVYHLLFLSKHQLYIYNNIIVRMIIIMVYQFLFTLL